MCIYIKEKREKKKIIKSNFKIIFYNKQSATRIFLTILFKKIKVVLNLNK